MTEVAGERVLLPGDEARVFRFLERHLDTSEHNQPARRAYSSLGYEVTGDFGLVLF
jgi:hypothetical protein